MFAVDESIGEVIDKASKDADNTGRLALTTWLIFIGVMALFILIMYFVRKRFISKADRKAKVLRLP